MTHAVSNPILIPNQAFTGESFLRHIFSSDQLSSSPTTSESKPPTVLVYSAPKELLPKSLPNGSPNAVGSENMEAPCSPPSSPVGRTPVMSCDEATSAMIKLLNLKSKPTDVEETLQLKFDEQNGEDPLKLITVKSSQSFRELKNDKNNSNSSNINASQQSFLDMLKRAKADSEKKLEQNKMKNINETPRTHKTRPPGSRHSPKTPVFYR